MSKRRASIFVGLGAATALAFTGTAGVFSQSASAASYPIYPVLAYWANSADTIIVAINGRAEKVRMIGIDAPEATSRDNTKKGCYAIQAKLLLKNIIHKQFVRLEKDAKMPDRYTDGSLLRYVYVPDYGDVGATMIYNGGAKEYMYQHKNYGSRSWYKTLQNLAYGRNVGIWSSSICPMNR
ncbi:thermonuclease family protein [Candidatus Saccharibacteria bacterium]|nr:thermonuclease family protein [Candidatus Saccharibacteria bacterium]